LLKSTDIYVSWTKSKEWTTLTIAPGSELIINDLIQKPLK